MIGKRKYLQVGTILLVVVIVIAVIGYIQNMERQYNEAEVDQLVNAVLANPKPEQIKRLLDYPEKHTVDGIFAIHYMACLWHIANKHQGVFEPYRDSKADSYLKELSTLGRDAFEEYYPKGRE